MNSAPDQARPPAGKISGRGFDPQLAAYEVLRRLVCGRAPFLGLPPEHSSVPDDLRSEVGFGCLVHQVSVYLDVLQRKFGHIVSERARTHLLLLAGFDPKLEAGLIRFLESIRAADAEFKAGRFSEAFEGPSADLTRYYSTLAILVLIASGCPELRQRSLTGVVGECLLAARFKADDVFDSELKCVSEVAGTFEWCLDPGPFERQLRRQHNNPLFPVTVRTVSTQQVTEARLSDLKLISDFMSAYRTIEREVLSPRAKTGVKEASDLEKRMIDLIPSCVLLGRYLSKELAFLSDVSDSLDKEVSRVTGETGLRDVYERCMALSRIQGRLLAISIGVPSSGGMEDFQLRSILSESHDLISSNAQALGATSALGDELLDAERIIKEAIREGLCSSLARQKLDAFRSGFSEGRRLVGKNGLRVGIWARVVRFVRRS